MNFYTDSKGIKQIDEYDYNITKCDNVAYPLDLDITRNLKELYCIENLNTDIYGYFTSNSTQILSFSVSACDINTNPNCASESELKTFVNSHYFSIYYMNSIVDINNISNPIKKKLGYTYSYLNYAQLSETNLFYKKLLIESDDGVVFENKVTNEDIMISRLTNINGVRLDDEGSFSNINVYLLNDYSYYKRNYIKLQNVFADLGGIIKCLY